ncbi:MAG: metal-dependent transcriptional regulator, partial [Bacilli bacterium]|nr:metal-dependent transcriptional regulator [Bacilli bacterium]
TMKYTKAQEDFVEAMLMLEQEGRPLETTLIAEKLHISKPAVHQMGHELIDRGLITRKDYGPLKLTAKGREVAEKVLHRHRTLHRVLVLLGVPDDIAEEDCCLIEHVLSETTFEAIEKWVNEKAPE